MATLDEICRNCGNEINAVFGPGGSRQKELIAGDLTFNGCCFVRDEITFINGRLIFVPSDPRNPEETYCQEYVVFCRKLIIVNGGKPPTTNPCGPDNPGSIYQNRNVIIWSDRLKPRPDRPFPNPFTAAGGTSHDRNTWSSNGNPNGNNGAHGGAGNNGGVGLEGIPGMIAPKFTLVALEVEFTGLGSYLSIDFDGQVGGRGQRGQNGGDGGNGMGGRPGESDTSWPGTGCDRSPGSGGNGGNGGDGGMGAKGGHGGNAGEITIISTSSNLATVFAGGDIGYVNSGGNEGEGGLGGFGGKGGLGGNPGMKTIECDPANTGANGSEGFPPPQIGNGSTANQGVPGDSGSSAPVKFVEIDRGSCADLLPLDVDAQNVNPSVLCRGFSTPSNNAVLTIQGNNLSQVTQVASSHAPPLSFTIKPTSTDTQLDLSVDIPGNSGLGLGHLTFQRDFGPDQTVPNSLEVKRFEVLSVAPVSGARNSQVAVTITGSCFDPSSVIQQVQVSGTGVSALNVLVLNDTTVQCVFDISQLAQLTTRDVTVKTGSSNHTLLGVFQVTS